LFCVLNDDEIDIGNAGTHRVSGGQTFEQTHPDPST
jgi:hypothetical protein